jgi:Rrf2 family protein
VKLALTKRADYGIRAVLALARAGEGELISARSLAADQGIPVAFLSRLMSDLVASRIVDGVPGRIGGYRLARRPQDLSILDIIEAIEGDPRRHNCILRGGPCPADDVCTVHPLFASAQADLLARLREATVADLVA